MAIFTSVTRLFLHESVSLGVGCVLGWIVGTDGAIDLSDISEPKGRDDTKVPKPLDTK